MEIRGQASGDGANKSTTWDISDVNLLATCLSVNSTVSAQCHQHLEDGNDMPIVHQAVVGAKFLVSNSSFTLSISRSLTRLKQLYFVLASTAADKKPVRDFVCRADAAMTVATDLTLFQVSCGSYRIPDAPCVGLVETYWRFLQAAGKAYTTEDVARPIANYQSNSMIYAVDVEKQDSTHKARH